MSGTAEWEREERMSGKQWEMRRKGHGDLAHVRASKIILDFDFWLREL